MEKNELENFADKINKISAGKSNLDEEQQREIVSEINKFLFTSHKDIGTLHALGTDFNYFSEFHRYWDNNYKNILNITISDESCEQVAVALHDVYLKSEGKAFKTAGITSKISLEEFCNIRLLTANQDFNGSRNPDDIAEKYLKSKSAFDLKNINSDPAAFVKAIGVTNLSQNDKRESYAKNISQFFLDYKTTPYKIIDHFDNDVFELRNALINYEGAGYGNKKADMVIRDMVVLGVWKDVKGFEKINVASDVNTIKIALRTGILRTSIPLVSSFLDYFGVQYGYVDDMSAQAWRRVWEIWCEKFPSESIASPCLLDYFVYNVLGRQFCKENLNIFKCEKGHIFKWHSGRNKYCRVCSEKKIKATNIGKILPCDDPEGEIAIKETQFAKSGVMKDGIKECPFKSICDKYNKKYLQSPKAISILGQTGWDTAYTDEKSGGGGLMA